MSRFLPDIRDAKTIEEIKSLMIEDIKSKTVGDIDDIIQGLKDHKVTDINLLNYFYYTIKVKNMEDKKNIGNLYKETIDDAFILLILARGEKPSEYEIPDNLITDAKKSADSFRAYLSQYENGAGNKSRKSRKNKSRKFRKLRKSRKSRR